MESLALLVSLNQVDSLGPLLRWAPGTRPFRGSASGEPMESLALLVSLNQVDSLGPLLRWAPGTRPFRGSGSGEPGWRVGPLLLLITSVKRRLNLVKC